MAYFFLPAFHTIPWAFTLSELNKRIIRQTFKAVLVFSIGIDIDVFERFQPPSPDDFSHHDYLDQSRRTLASGFATRPADLSPPTG
jgi:hypothetical protein